MEKKKSSRKEQKPAIRATRAVSTNQRKEQEGRASEGEEREGRGKKKRVHTDAPVHDGPEK
jgi:hypothetical protein